MAALKHIPLVDVTRGDIVESTHYGSVSITFGQTNPLISVGEDQYPAFLRSSAKPFQALAFLERGGAQEFNLSAEEIAIMCASHSGTDQHVQVLQELHARIGLNESMLQCGTHIPYDKTTAARMLKNSEPLRPYRSDCSGKHTGMLAFAKMLGAPLDSYLNLDHPVQKHILRTFAEMCEVEETDIVFGVDGCSAPVFAIPIPNAARGFAKLCQPDQLPNRRAHACRQITQSMSAHPFMVAGPNRFDTDFMAAVQGKAISKVGAEGYLTIGVFPDANPLGTGSIGIAIKIADGDTNWRAAGVVAIEILKKLGVLDAREIKTLINYHVRPVTNWHMDAVGWFRPADDFLTALENISN